MSAPTSLPPRTLFSADSHVLESLSLWEGLLPETFWSELARSDQNLPGAEDPVTRVEKAASDGVFGEILYPTLGLAVFGVDAPDLQAASCHRYNEGLVDYCAAAPDRLFGIGMIPIYDIDVALKELDWCARTMCGSMIWQAPHPSLPLSSPHYDPFWEASAELGLPVSLHILTGFDFSRDRLTTAGSGEAPREAEWAGPSIYSTPRWLFGIVRHKLDTAIDALTDLVVGGVFERHPDLRVVMVENEIGWVPYLLDQLDFYARGKREPDDPAVVDTTWPSSYVARNVFFTFFRDPIAGSLEPGWGHDNCMWSNDFPHPNSTWPHSREVVEDRLGALPDDVIEKLTWRNAVELYRLPWTPTDRSGNQPAHDALDA
jgi:predicted TIM-barrel fold metal-dependent hydrolase